MYVFDDTPLGTHMITLVRPHDIYSLTDAFSAEQIRTDGTAQTSLALTDLDVDETYEVFIEVKNLIHGGCLFLPLSS